MLELLSLYCIKATRRIKEGRGVQTTLVVRPGTMITIGICEFLLLSNMKNYTHLLHYLLRPVAALSKVWICGRSLAGIAGSNPAGAWMSICCVLSCQSLRRDEHSFRGILPSVVCLIVITKSRK